MISEVDITQTGVAIACLLFIIKMMWEGVLKLKSSKTPDVAVSLKGISDKLEQLVTSIDQQNVNDKTFRRDFYEMKSQTKDLHNWHDKEDGDGRKIWYFKASLENAIIENTKVLKDNIQQLMNLEKTIKALDT